MKLKNLVLIWRVDGTQFLRCANLNEINLSNFDSRFTCDGAIHEKFKNTDHETRIKWLAKMIERLLLNGYTMEHIHFSLTSLEGYQEAHDMLIEKYVED